MKTTYTGLKAATIIVLDGSLTFSMVKSEKDVTTIANAGGTLFEDWETAQKTAHVLEELGNQGGEAGQTISIGNHKQQLFLPCESEIPVWAEVISPSQAIKNLTAEI